MQQNPALGLSFLPVIPAAKREQRESSSRRNSAEKPCWRYPLPGTPPNPRFIEDRGSPGPEPDFPFGGSYITGIFPGFRLLSTFSHIGPRHQEKDRRQKNPPLIVSLTISTA